MWMSSLRSPVAGLGRCRRCAPIMGRSVGSVTTSRTRCTTGWRSAIASSGTSPRKCVCRGTQWRTRFEFEGDGKRRPFTYDEVERLFDTADARVELLVASGRKGALGALRDAQLLKTVYAFGLRRTEAVMLDTVDLHHNAKMRQWGRFGAIHVRWAKAAGGGAPRRRTVLLVPEFDWWVPGMQQWLEQARERFAPGDDLDALWVTERRTRLSAGYLDRRFAELRDEAGLSKDLTAAQPPAFLCDAPAGVRLRRSIRPGAGRAHARVDDLDLRLCLFGLQEPGARRSPEGPHRRRS